MVNGVMINLNYGEVTIRIMLNSMPANPLINLTIYHLYYYISISLVV